MARETLRIKRRIAKFIRLVDDCKELPLPNPGDCWLCSMKDKEGKTMGSMPGDDSDAEHLSGHMDEEYLHGSLIVNALLHKGYSEKQLPYVFRSKHIVKLALRKYLMDKLGIGSKSGISWQSAA
jgi:hypothetical protein